MSGYWTCSLCTTGTSTILSVNFNRCPCLFVSLAPASNSKYFFRGLPLLSGRFESAWTWRYVTIRRLTNMSLCSTCGTRTVDTGLYCTYQSPHFSGRSALLQPTSVPPRALDTPMYCSSGISNVVNFFFCLLTWLTFLLDGRILFHCTFILMILTITASSFDLLVHLGPFLSG